MPSSIYEENLYPQSQCIEFEGEEEYCGKCGYNQDHHTPRVYSQIRCSLKFVNELEGREASESQLICVDKDAPAADLLRFMVLEWKMQAPNLVVSILGAASVRLDPSLRERIREGLVKAVSTTDSWVFTAGTNAGLNKVVAEAVKQAQHQEWVGEKQSSVKCIGFNSWGCIDNHENMEHWLMQTNRKRQPFRYKVKQKTEPGLESLNPSHSFFILVDCGKRKRSDMENALRSNIEAIISEHGIPSINSENLDGVPIVEVLVGGNYTIFESIAASLEIGIPVVICEGSGGAADVLASAIRLGTEKHMSETEKWLLPEKEETIRKMICDTCGCTFADEEALNILMRAIVKCIQKDMPVTIYKLAGKSQAQELDAAILQALLKGKVAQGRDQLELALKWNRDDVASTDILANESDISRHKNIDHLMLSAIMDRKSNFVKLFMECGFVMKDFLTARRLEILYNYAAQTNEVLGWLLKKVVKPKKSLTPVHYLLSDVAKLLHELTGTYQGSSKDVEGTQIDDIQTKEDYDKTFDYPFVELTLWAVLANRKDMSLFFWAHAKEPIMLALISSKLWSSLACRLWPGEDVFEPEFIANSEEYQDLAVGVIEECYKTDHDLSRLLVEVHSLIWRGKTRVDVAVLATCKKFLATPCVQASVENTWKSNMRCSFGQIVWYLLNPFAIKNIDIVINDPCPIEEEPVSCELSDNIFTTDCGKEQISFLEVSPALTSVIEKDPTDDIKDLNLEVRFFPPNDSNNNAAHLNMSYWKKFSIFYKAPITKFFTHSGAYVIFILLYSWMVLQVSGNDISNLEIFVIILAATYAIEELRQLITEDAKWTKKLRAYLQSEWNVMDLSYLSMIFIAFGLSLLKFRELATIIYGLVTLLLWIRLIRLYQAVDRLGPLWIMMRKMFKEMIVFITVLVVFLLGYGICSVALIFSAEKDPPELGDIFKWVFIVPSLQMFGELFLDNILNSDETLSSEQQFQTSLTVWLLAGYLLIGNVLILNLLIAIFGHIYEMVAENSTIEWKNEMFLLCKEFLAKPVLPPPFSFVEMILNIFRSCCVKKSEPVSLSEAMLERLRIFESYCASLYRTQKESQKTLDQNILLLSEHAEEEMEKISDMINVVDYLRQDLEPSSKTKRKGKKSSKK